MMLERRKWESALAQHETAAPAALAASDRGQYIISEAKADEARAQIGLIDTWLARGRIVAPFDGLVIEGDLMQSLGAPVKRGEVLLTIAPKGEYRLVVEVDDRDIAAVRPGQHGEVVLGALAEDKLPFVVERVTPVASARDGRNFFEVFAKMDSAHDLLQPGLRGVARISAGEKTIAWIASHRLLDWVRVTLWSWGV
jgi:multidrug resistance efflux pump